MVISQRSSPCRTAHSSNSNLLTSLASELTLTAGRQGPSNGRDSGWSVFRMLLLSDQWDGDDIEKIRKKTRAQIGIYPVAGVNVVMVSAKEDSALSAPPAVRGFVEVHKYFLDRVNYFYSGSPFCFTRLLVSDAQASSLIASNMIKTIAKESQTFLSIYLTGNVILELMGIPEGVNKAVGLIASYLRGFTVDESMVVKLEACGGISVPNTGLSDADGNMAFTLSANYLGIVDKSMVPEFEDPSCIPTANHGEPSSNGGDVGGFLHFDTLKAYRRKTVSHVASIPMSCVNYVIGQNGKNIQSIRQKCSATIILEHTSRRNQVQMTIQGGSKSEVEKAKKVMEDLTGGLPLFQHVLTSMVICEAVRHKPNMKIVFAKDLPAISRKL